MAKVTLYVKDQAVVAHAKTYAEAHGTSVSELVEQFLDSLSSKPAALEEEAPILRQLQSALRGVKGGMADYRKYIEKKYG